VNGGAPEAELADLQRLAERAAEMGGREAAARFRGRQMVELKSDGSEVTTADTEIERMLVRLLHENRPHDGFIGEENTAGRGSLPASGEARVWWTIDPIDGTRNFIRGGGPFTCTVAALVDGTPIAGSIFFPLENLSYSAAAGRGVFVGGRRLEEFIVASGPRNPQPLVAIPSGWRAESGDFVKRLLETSVVRSFGCATAHLAYVATGGLDATFMTNCKLWDIAAGWLIACEAGMRVTRPDGGPLFPIDARAYAGEEMPLLAGTPDLHTKLVELRRSLP
jgi:myo-inositol-1(or 4)-monophosphatase